MKFRSYRRPSALLSTLLVFATLVAFCPADDGLAAQASARRKVIIDQDAFGPAGSDLQAILMLLQSPDVEVLGITIPSGDGWRDEEVSHTLRLLEIAQRTEVPVYPGLCFHCSTPRAWTEVWPAEGAVRRTPYHADPYLVPLSRPVRRRSSQPTRAPPAFWRAKCMSFPAGSLS